MQFCCGAIAPFVAGKLAEHVSPQAPFFLGAAMTAVGVAVLFFYRRSLVPATEPLVRSDGETKPAVGLQLATARVRPLLVAVAGPSAREVSAMAVPLARARGGDVHVLRVLEEDVVAGEDAVELETRESAEQLLDASVVEVRKSGIPVTGELLHTIGNHADAAARILERAAELDAGAIVIGPETTARRSAGARGGERR